MGLAIGIVVVWFIIEMLLWVLLAQFMSGWYVFIWFVIAAFLGIGMIKKTAQTLNPMAQQMKAGVIPNATNQPPESVITKSVATGLSGLLLLLPGLMTDVMAGLLMLPFVQKKLTQKAKAYALKNQDKMMAMMAKQMGGSGLGAMGGNPFGMGNPFGGTTIDGQAKTINKPKNIRPANDD